MYVRVPREVCLRARKGGRRPTRDSQGSLMCARDGLRRNTRHMPDQSCARRHRHWRRWKSTCLRSQRANVRARYWHWSTCRGCTFTLQHELPPEDYQLGDEHRCGLLRYSLYGTRDAAQNWEEELASTLSSLGLTRGSACPCV